MKLSRDNVCVYVLFSKWPVQMHPQRPISRPHPERTYESAMDKPNAVTPSMIPAGLPATLDLLGSIVLPIPRQ